MLDRAHRRKMTPRRSHTALGWFTLYQSCTVAYSTDYSREEGNPRRSLTILKQKRYDCSALRVDVKFMLYRER